MSTNSPKIISLEDHTVTDPRTIAKSFKNFFCSLAAGVQSEVPFHIKPFLNIYHHLTKTRFSSHLVQKKK